jgi:hypothetical protein
MILVAVAILVGVFFVATGRGGELAYEHADHAPLDLGPVSATDVVLLRPPTALWGYNMQVTDEALERIAQAIRDRDVTIAFLQQRLADMTAHPAQTPQAAQPTQLTQAGQLTQAAQPTQAAPALQPAEPPRAHRAQPARSADAGDPPGPEHPAEPAGQAQAHPDDSALAAEEQPW